MLARRRLYDALQGESMHGWEDDPLFDASLIRAKLLRLLTVGHSGTLSNLDAIQIRYFSLREVQRLRREIFREETDFPNEPHRPLP
ncbi:MAG: hypothetical protein PHW10_01155 [Candidatus Peribacteraceae bacterium]|nr:hypothetical protein [Candidatus Peribacteraceae bacterium]